MSMIDQQSDIFNEISNILYEYKNNDDDIQIHALVNLVNENISSIEKSLTLKNTGESKSIQFNIEHSGTISHEIFKLHGLMKEHTGGAWSEMTLTLTADGQLKTDFKYPDKD